MSTNISSGGTTSLGGVVTAESSIFSNKLKTIEVTGTRIYPAVGKRWIIIGYMCIDYPHDFLFVVIGSNEYQSHDSSAGYNGIFPIMIDHDGTTNGVESGGGDALMTYYEIDIPT